MICQETAGFLFKHKCSNEGEMQCMGCTRWVCLEHAQETTQGNRCITCAKGILAKQPAGYGRDTVVYNDSPYFYSYRYGGFGTYHSHWHSYSDRNDLVEGDGAAFVNANPDRFEDDLDAS